MQEHGFYMNNIILYVEIACIIRLSIIYILNEQADLGVLMISKTAANLHTIQDKSGSRKQSS